MKPGVEEFLCQKVSHQSDSMVLGSTETTMLMLLGFFNFFSSLLLFLDFLWGAMEHMKICPPFGQ
ncbi:hypothetical protein FH972_006098 [Carpinus fangiana]|uniref:Uncharacterized protein n=1 Tax=Carpinus fangiana TaxID=176857 RepID=A0A5N6QRK2_9ROSI|nr:hypothetical protein FH972_006098 [Carpinus fangiana]